MNTQTFIILILLLSHSILSVAQLSLEQASAQQVLAKDKYRLSVNQSNIFILRRERRVLTKELKGRVAQQEGGGGSAALSSEINNIKDSIAVADTLIKNISAMVSKEQQRIATLVRGTPPSALDTALSKALNSNLPELLKNLSSNEAARKEAIRLRSILKQQSLARGKAPASGSVSLAGNEFIAEEEFLRLLSLFSNENANEEEDKLIRIAGKKDNISYIEEEILSALGRDQYYVEAVVHSGDITFFIDGRPWQLKIKEEDDEATYIIIYDVSNLAEPRLVMFNKLLLSE